MIKWCKSVEYTLKRILKDEPTPAKGLESNPAKKAEMYSCNHPYYPQPQTCIWLKLAKGGAEARLGWFFNAEGVKCPGDCNKCNYFRKLPVNPYTQLPTKNGRLRIHKGHGKNEMAETSE